MIYKEYGKTGKKVSALGFGGMRFNEPDFKSGNLQACADTVLYAFEKGINYFDTAPYYNDDKSEIIFGMALKEMPRDKFYISTKCGYFENDGNAYDELRKNVERSLTRLNVTAIDFFHLWCIMDYKGYENMIKQGSLYDAAKKLQEEGLINHLCYSTHAEGAEIEKMMDERDFAGMLVSYNASNWQYTQEAVKKAHKKGMGVTTMNPLGGGLIPAKPEVFDGIKEDGFTLAQSALRFIMRQPEITIALSGMASFAQIDENIAALKDGIPPFTADEFTALTDKFSVSIKNLCTGCGYCLPCPKGCDIPKYMESFNHKLLTGTDTAVWDRMKWRWSVTQEDAKKCISCKLCEGKCTQHLPIAERMNYIAGMVKE